MMHLHMGIRRSVLFAGRVACNIKGNANDTFSALAHIAS
jgi:hypothetical protein